MRIAYVNAHYRRSHTGGGNAHMEQFVANSTALGHEIWSYADFAASGAHRLPTARVAHIRAMRRMDALYVRLESGFPDVCTWARPPRRALYGFPVVVWEFNTVPEHGLLRGRTDDEIREAVNSFTQYGRGCDLAVCVSDLLAGYVRDTLGIRRTLVVPNGSDPDVFRPEAPALERMATFAGKLNVVWIGSGKEPWHDFPVLVETARIVFDGGSGRDVAFHLMGPDLVGVMADMPPNVYYWGAEHYEKLPRWLASMDVGLNLYGSGPADYSCPLKVFDYMSSGLVVVSTSQPFTKDLFSQLGQTDLIVPTGDAKMLAGVLTALASDRERVRRQGLAGRQLVIDRYNWRRAVQDTMSEIEAILREKGKAPKA